MRLVKRPPNLVMVNNLVHRNRCPPTNDDGKAYNLSFLEIGDEAVLLPSRKCASRSDLLQLHRHAKRGPLNTRSAFVDPYGRQRFTLSQRLIDWLQA
jgi:hypothetical protein